MRPDAFIGVQQHLLQATVYAHALVFGEILEERSETFLQAQRHIDSLDFDRRAGVVQGMSEHQEIPVQVAHGVVTDAIWSVVDCLRDFDGIGPVEFVQLVGVADKKIDRASLRTGSGRAFLQENLHSAKAHAGECRRLAPSERLLEAELLGVEFEGGWNITDRQAGVDLLAFDERLGWSRYMLLPAA